MSAQITDDCEFQTKNKIHFSHNTRRNVHPSNSNNRIYCRFFFRVLDGDDDNDNTVYPPKIFMTVWSVRAAVRVWFDVDVFFLSSDFIWFSVRCADINTLIAIVNSAIHPTKYLRAHIADMYMNDERWERERQMTCVPLPSYCSSWVYVTPMRFMTIQNVLIHPAIRSLIFGNDNSYRKKYFLLKRENIFCFQCRSIK